MSLRRFVPLTFCLALSALSLSHAGIISSEPFALWEFDEGLSSRVVGLDLDPSTPGLETLNVNTRFTYLPFNPVREVAGGVSVVRSFFKIRIDVYDASGAQAIRSFQATMVSEPFIDPADPLFGVGSEQPTTYLDAGGDAYNPLEDGFPEDDRVGVGIGIGEDGVRVLVLGLSFSGSWFNPALKASDQLSRFWVSAWDADAGELLWQKSFDGEEDASPVPWELSDDFSGVGDFLPGDGGIAEVRVVQERELSYGASQQKWRFFNLVSGAQTSNRIVTVPRP